MNILLLIISYLHSCNDCIYHKEPNLLFTIYKKNDRGFCMYHKDYALLSIQNEKKCGYNAKDFNPKFRKINSKFMNP